MLEIDELTSAKVGVTVKADNAAPNELSYLSDNVSVVKAEYIS